MSVFPSLAKRESFLRVRRLLRTTVHNVQMGDTDPMPIEHDGFLKRFVKIACERDGVKSHDGEDSTVSKRQKMLVKTDNMTAPLARYALGGDDNLYMQLGLSVLHTGTEQQALAPSALYNLDAVHAIREGIQQNVLTEIKRRKSQANVELENVRRRLNRIFGTGMGLDEFLPGNLKFSKGLVTEYDPLKNTEFIKMLKDMLSALDSENRAGKAILEHLVCRNNEKLNSKQQAQEKAKLEAKQQAKLQAELETAQERAKKDAQESETQQKELMEKLDALKRAQLEAEQLNAQLQAELLSKIRRNKEAEKKANQHAKEQAELQAKLETLQERAERADNALKAGTQNALKDRQAMIEAAEKARKAQLEAKQQLDDERLDYEAKSQIAEKKAQEQAQEQANQHAKEQAKLQAKLENTKEQAEEQTKKQAKLQAKLNEAYDMAREREKLHAKEQTKLAKKLAELKDANDALLKQGQSSTTSAQIGPQLVEYVISRGLCGHKGPMEEYTGAPTDRLLPYDAPKSIASDVALFKTLKLPKGAAVKEKGSKHTAAAVDEAIAAFGGNFAIDDTRTPSEKGPTIKDARQVRWEPVGEHAEAMATAAALEHAVARCGQLLDDMNSTLSNDAKLEIENARLYLKLLQMDSLHELSCAAEDGKTVHCVPTNALVTRPVATIRGKLHLAHDAGHYEAPDTTTVLSDTRWTSQHIKDDAEFRSQSSTNGIYKAPAPHELGYLPTSTGVPFPQRVEFAVDPTDKHYPNGAILEAIRSLVEYGLYYADVPEEETIKATLSGSSKKDDALGTAKSRRSGIWNEMLRDIAISTDRLWTFVRTLSGLIGDDASSLLITADDASVAASRELQAQKKITADRVAAFQTKIVESLIGSLMKDSGLRLDADKAKDELVVINAETAKQINDLASGESGRPFFEANVALRSLTENGTGGKQRLGDVVGQLNGIVSELHKSLDAELLTPNTSGASLAELSMPRNSYFVKLRDDTSAAIRSAFDTFCVESSVKGVGRICLWELVEGCDHTLCTRFADFVGHVLIQNRTSTGVSALYASRQQLTMNASQAAVSLQRLIHHAAHYRSRYTMPTFWADGGATTTLAELRINYFTKTQEQGESWANGAISNAIRYAQSQHYRHVERNPIPSNSVPWIAGLQY